MICTPLTQGFSGTGVMTNYLCEYNLDSRFTVVSVHRKGQIVSTVRNIISVPVTFFVNL